MQCPKAPLKAFFWIQGKCLCGLYNNEPGLRTVAAKTLVMGQVNMAKRRSARRCLENAAYFGTIMFSDKWVNENIDKTKRKPLKTRPKAAASSTVPLKLSPIEEQSDESPKRSWKNQRPIAPSLVHLNPPSRLPGVGRDREPGNTHSYRPGNWNPPGRPSGGSQDIKLGNPTVRGRPVLILSRRPDTMWIYMTKEREARDQTRRAR